MIIEQFIKEYINKKSFIQLEILIFSLYKRLFMGSNEQMATIAKRPHIDAILSFFDEIGIEYKVEDEVKGSFSPNIDIRKGVVHLDYSKVLIVDLLHESGHLALVPKKYRELFTGNLYKGFREYQKTVLDLPIPFGDKTMDVLMTCDDTEVTAWSWALGRKLGLPPEDIITDESYDGNGAGIRDSLLISENSSMPYAGVTKLHHALYTEKINRMTKAQNPDAQFYPHMKHWTADSVLAELDMAV